VEATVANDLALDGKGRLREHVKRAFLTGQQRPAGSEMALEEQGRGPNPEGQGCGKGAVAGGACVQRLLMRAQRAMVWVSDPAAKACWTRPILETV
jgi:hypothetical protein